MLDELLKEYKGPADIIGPEGLLKQLTKALIERAMDKDRKPVATDLRSIYTAASEEAALSALEAFSAKWDDRFPMISRSWRLRWAELVPFFKFPETIRKAIYTTNAIESLNYTVRKVTRHRLSFPSADAAMKLVFMALQNISKKRTMPIHEWKSALGQFIIFYGDRVPL